LAFDPLRIWSKVEHLSGKISVFADVLSCLLIISLKVQEEEASKLLSRYENSSISISKMTF
jgi:hypothetical protein